ncbi:MAG: hypothetical protein GXO47_05520, partial [Chlorobi bacterium]|nr:hypothetical protein [Chlorobiota bacterium]
PIERHRKFLPQLKKVPEYNYENIVKGGRMFLFGLMMKVIIGDSFGIVLNNIFDNVSRYSSLPVLIVFFILPAQIYADFAGYTLMALGLGRIFGFNLSENFRRPFWAGDISGFWKRWHISLTSWCNDFIFNRILLKRRKWGKIAFVYSVFVTFLIIGIWHGANWTFVVLGVLQAAILTFEFFTLKKRKEIGKKMTNDILYIIGFLYVYLWMAFSLIFFFSHNIKDAYVFLKKLSLWGGWKDGYSGLDVNDFEFIFSFFLFIALLIYEYLKERGVEIDKWFFNRPRGVRWTVYIIVFLFVIYFSKNQNPFKYADF